MQRCMSHEPPAKANLRRPGNATAQLAGAFLFLLVFWAFLPALHNGFLTYDDPEYVTANPYVKNGLTLAGVKWAFAAHGANWHPLTWISHLLDGQFFGMQPWGHHFTNVLLHAINTVLAFALLRKISGATWRSFALALLFGLHPLRAESVAWVAERKDVLSVFFGLLTLLAYADYAQQSKIKNQKSKIFYVLALLLFALGLLSKSMLVTFPFVLLLLDFWPLERAKQIGWPKLVLEKIPFFIFTAAMCIIAHNAQKNGAAMVSTLSFRVRLQNALISYWRYLGKIFWPADLSPFYPRVQNWSLLVVFAAALLLAAVCVWAVARRKKAPWFFVGWFWYVGTLVPVIGFIQIGEQSIADRYTYIPSLGILIAIVWSAHQWIQSVRWRERVAFAALVATAICFVGLTREQVRCWRTTESLFARAVQATPDSTMACIGLGACLVDRGEFDQAIPLYRHAVALSPSYYEGHYDLAVALAAKGQLDEAVTQYNLALRSFPTSGDCHLNLGVALAQQGHLDEAIAETVRATELAPASSLAQCNLAKFQLQKGRFDDALEHFRIAIKLDPNNADLHNDIGSILAQRGQLDPAIAEFQAAVKLNPNHSVAQGNLAHAQRLKDQAAAQH
jgi:Flp pilus assembly protein TadD